MRALASQQVGKCSRFEPAHQRAADHPAMSSDENLIRFIHELHSQVVLAFSVFTHRAILLAITSILRIRVSRPRCAFTASLAQRPRIDGSQKTPALKAR